MARKFWSKTPAPLEIAACVDDGRGERARDRQQVGLRVRVGPHLGRIPDVLNPCEPGDLIMSAQGFSRRGFLGVFLTRMIDDQPARNVVVCFMGEFARDLPSSGHQPNLSVTVIGKYVKPGTTGRTDANVGLKAGTPGIAGMWAYLAAAPKASGSPFGANPHGLVL